ncbi:hypothetical protein HUG10_05940 [Halorarum halophilum]|uniref:Halobacterial output domain-containing protein n=1 Tax=Halorarum halophilum TaxID=2743090 RepID=A0A7D5GB48_9EURY|nr:HalOD1 output domain-containing protein [Halobaculum halophilum]QLG27112.1 hypothetical protein HUG10_05940 [Halobaculum halophilum]
MKYQMNSGEAVSTAVIQAVSTAENTPVQSLPPLTESVDPDALYNIFSLQNGKTPDRWGSTSFTFSTSLVTISHSEYIEVTPMTNAAPAADAGTEYSGTQTVQSETRR